MMLNEERMRIVTSGREQRENEEWMIATNWSCHIYFGWRNTDGLMMDTEHHLLINWIWWILNRLPVCCCCAFPFWLCCCSSLAIRSISTQLPTWIPVGEESLAAGHWIHSFTFYGQDAMQIPRGLLNHRDTQWRVEVHSKLLK